MATAVGPGLDTRAQIVSAAERLFATQGIDGVSLREINRAAGQRNVSALQYHFGDRIGLLFAILDKHRRDTEPRRHALLDEYEAAAADDLRALSAALVRPLAAKLADPDGGRDFLRIMADVFTRPDPIAELIPTDDPTNSVCRWHRLVGPLLPPEKRGALHFRFPAVRCAFVELACRAMSPPRRDDRVFTSQLIDIVTALLATPPSEETSRLLS